MQVHPKKFIALLLAGLLLIGLLPVSAAASDKAIAQEEAITQELPVSGFHHVELPGYRLPETRTRAADELPASYNSAELGYDTAVKNQAPYGTCWAFGTLSPIETYMIKHGLPVGETGMAATTSLDLSEYHLSYFAYTDAYDALGLTAGDSSVLTQSHLNIGGDGYKSTLTLMRWEGPASEENPALAYDRAGVGTTIDPSLAYSGNVAHLADVDWIPASDQQSVKQALMEYGAGFFGYYFNSAYNTTDRSGAYCCIQATDANGDYAHASNHAVTLVGWDDNYPKENFNSISRPTQNGAWIVKNSWGTTGSNAAYTKNGYNYISYEDTASLNEICMFFRVEPVDKYQHLYQYDGTLNIDDYVGLTANHSQIANVFTAQGHEQLRAVSILTLEEGLGYTLEIYKGLTAEDDPTSGELLSTQEGSIRYHGYHTIELDQPVSVASGERFSCVFTLHSQQPSNSLMMVLPVDASRVDEYEGATLTHTHALHENTSFFRIAGTVSQWSQPKNGAANFRIKAYTVDDPYALSAVSANPEQGSVSVGAFTERGWVVTAQPAAGYYADGWELISGSVTVEQEGNSFYVLPSEDSVIAIRFAEKRDVTVTLLANGETVAEIPAVTGEPITLPAQAPAFEGYTFLGWTGQALADATAQPQTFAPGGSYVPTGDDTLHALYHCKKLEVAGQDGSYVKVTADEDLTDGRYLIVNEQRQLALNGALIDHAIDVLDNEMPVSVQAGRIPENETVNDGAFTYHAENHSLSGKREASSGNVYYIASPSWKNWIQYIYTTPYETPATRLSFSFAADGSAQIHDTYYDSDLRYYESGSEANFRFTKTSTGSYPIALYRKTEDTTRNCYTTLPGAPAHVHTPGAPVEENRMEPSCTSAGGYDTVIYCTACGAELSRTHTDIPATGHTPGAPVEENRTEPSCTGQGGYDTVTYCSVCGAELSRVHEELAATGHDWNAPEYVWAEDCSTVTATRSCKMDGSHTETETVSTRAEVTKEATVETEGEITYTAQFANPAFAAQTRTVATPKLDDPGEGLPCDGEHCPGSIFTDMPPKGNWAHDAIDWAVVHGVTSGTSPTKFSPNAGCTRAQVVTFLWRAAGCPAPTGEENPFTDVSGGYYYDAVLWAVEEGITSGTSATKFSPNATCTRGQIVTFLWRYEHMPEPAAAANPFTDVKPGAYYEKAVLWAAQTGVTAGTTATTFRPDATCTRAQVVTFLYRDIAD